MESNLVGFVCVLKGTRQVSVEHLVYAYSSSVTKSNVRLSLSEHDSVDHPHSLYPATKRSNELIAHPYSHLFFKVFGPCGRPDISLFSFTMTIPEGRDSDVCIRDRMVRDFPYDDDILVRVLDDVAAPADSFNVSPFDPVTRSAPPRALIIRNSQPLHLEGSIAAIGSALGLSAERRYLPPQYGDVLATHADIAELEPCVGARSRTSVRDGLPRVVICNGRIYGI